MKNLKVGFVGLGLMGHAMATNVIKKGFSTFVVAHRKRGPIDDLVRRGAQEIPTASELASKVDAVILCLPGSNEVMDALGGDTGLLATKKSGLIVIDSSTGDPNRTQEINSLVAQSGGRYLDVPVNRTPKEAIEGRLNALVGGDSETLSIIKPVLSSFSETIHHLGDVGAGHKAKVIHNFIAQGNAAILAEAFCTAAKSGIDLQEFSEICNLSGGYSRTFERIIPFVLNGDDSGQQFALGNCEKDMRYYTQLTKSVPTTAFVAESVYQTFLLAKSLGHGEKYVPHLFDVLGEINGVSVHANSRDS